MRLGFVLVFLAGLAIMAVGQQGGTQMPSSQTATARTASSPPQSAPGTFAEDLKTPATTDEAKLKRMFEQKIEAEWEAIKNKDKKAYGDVLAEDYEGVEVDGKGERNKLQAMNELDEGNIFRYTLWGFRLIPLGSDHAFTIYEVTMEFPPRSQVRYSRIYVSALWTKQAGEWKEVHYQETHVK